MCVCVRGVRRGERGGPYMCTVIDQAKGCKGLVFHSPDRVGYTGYLGYGGMRWESCMDICVYVYDVI